MTDVDYLRVHAAEKIVGQKLEAERLARIKARNDAHVAAGGVICAWCTRPGRRFMNTRACEQHAPAPIRPTMCNKPLVCYGSCCVGAYVTSDQRRAQFDEQVSEWRAHARSEIMTVARIGLPFGPRELAGLLPIKLARGQARDWLIALLDDGVNAGVLIKVNGVSWRLRRDGEPMQRIETPPTSYTPSVNTDRIERDNRYQ